MPTEARLPGVESAREVLGLTLDEIAGAVRANPSTLYRWREGKAPNAVFLDRLERLEELVEEIRDALGPERAQSWLDEAAPVFDGRSPRQMIVDGRSETVLGALMSHQHLLAVLEGAQTGMSGFADLMARDDLSLSSKAALALLDRRVDDLVESMNRPEARSAAARAFATPPRVTLGQPRGSSEADR